MVDGTGLLLGVVPARALLRIQRREHVEDINRLAGIMRDSEIARHAIEDTARARAFKRLPWLTTIIITPARV